MADLKRLQDRHEAFLGCRPVDRPLIRPWFGGYYPAEQFPNGASRLQDGAVLRPEQVCFSHFREDYERLYHAYGGNEEEYGYVGSAYWGIPWLEAIAGCPVTVTATHCRAKPVLSGLDEAAHFVPNVDRNPWLDALVRFTKELAACSTGRFPVCPPLLRGPGDVAAAMLGEMTYATGFFDAPAVMRRLLEACARARLAVLRRLQAVIPSWHGVHAAGGYPSVVWSRRTVAYHQEDSAALLNPAIFREFVLPAVKEPCRAAEVNFLHLHSACLYPVDVLLEDTSFEVLQINIDHKGAGPPIEELIDVFRRIQAAARPLLLWGEFTGEDWKLIRRELSPVGLSLQPICRQTPIPGQYAWT